VFKVYTSAGCLLSRVEATSIAAASHSVVGGKLLDHSLSKHEEFVVVQMYETRLIHLYEALVVLSIEPAADSWYAWRSFSPRALLTETEKERRESGSESR
jgi:hypothetical protein